MENVKIHDLKEARELAERIFDAKGLVPYKGRDGVAGYWMNIPAKLIVGDTLESYVGYGTKIVMVIFKRDWFHSLATKFPKWRGEGYGMSVDLAILQVAAKRDGGVIFILPDGKIYGLMADEWLRQASSHDSIWVPSTETLTVASVPARLFKRMPYNES